MVIWGIMMSSEIINCFPGYEYVVEKTEDGTVVAHNMYRGTDLGFGGYVYSEPGAYSNVGLLDISSMHPSSLVLMNKLGDYTQRYDDLRKARVYIKHRDYESASKLFDGKLTKYLVDDKEADALSKAIKLPLNSFYGISSATFSNPAKDSRDKNNIIALRGALFMRTLQDEIEDHGGHIIAIRTDSCKIPNITPELVEFVQKFAASYGYEMEHECTYEKMCLVDKSSYIAKYDKYGIRNKGGKHAGEWTATATKFQVPYVFKTLFSKEPIIFEDLCEIKEVKRPYAMYLDMNEGLPDDKHDYHFIGGVGQFTPVKEGVGGGLLVKTQDYTKYEAVTGTLKSDKNKTPYRWVESESIRNMKKERPEDLVDKSYYISQVDKAVKEISKFCDFEWFTS